MPFQTPAGRIIATGLLAAATAGGAYAFNVRSRIEGANAGPITCRGGISDAFKFSKTVHELANPRRHQSAADSYSITLDIPPQHRQVSDQVLLARFVRGFFGGYVLGPERVALQTLGRTLVNFSQAPPQKTIWSLGDLSETQLPPLHSLVFGAFQTLEVKLPGTDDREADVTQSHVDFGFGNEGSGFAGAHRFSIIRPKKDDSGVQRVEIRFESMACNPSVDKLFAPRIFYWFHVAYAQLLFREAVSHVCQGLQH